MGRQTVTIKSRRRDAMGRYSRAEGDFMAELRELMDTAPNDRMRQKIQNIISDMA
jgi:hypothetical protein